MRLTSIELSGFKSFAKKTQLQFGSAITSVVGPNGSGKSNIAESFRFVLGEQSMKSMRGRRGEDMIWNGSQSVPRAGRASVKLIFDNTDRALNLDFDEVAIERVVHRDGGNDYLLNGSQVRLRDIQELLAQANIGASGHHIISQGEADRILSASSKERREMIEDALGLTAYLYKREEAERKLEKTAENMREVESLRRELAPHLRFLGSQVKKIEESQKLRDDLTEKYTEYLKRESVYIKIAEATLAEEGDGPTRELKQLEERVQHLRQELEEKGKGDAGTRELIALEQEGRSASSRREAVMRELGRIEGEISALSRIAEHSAESIPAGQAREFAERVERELDEIHTFEAGDIQKIKNRLSALVVFAQEFLRRIANPNAASQEQSAHKLEEKKAALEKESEQLRVQETKISEQIAALRSRIEGEKDASRDAERELFSAMARRSELQGIQSTLRAKAELLSREKEQFANELREAGVLIGRSALEYASAPMLGSNGEILSEGDIVDEPRNMQEDRRRKVERMKIKLEEIGAGNSAEVLKEHTETVERDAFLGRELEDLATSAEKLRELIAELTKTLEVRFSSGIDKINTEFNTFFKLMFGGGEATLALTKEKKLKRGAGASEEEEVDEEDMVEVEEGIEISISLPHKRVKGLHMLSGGERALTSIALIFAMSQVNPPPFIILDETDAALDEANSRRYGDMIENLARKSQLILITHNRETMSRAGILYGITMGGDGISKLLSVKFEEALAVAK